MPESISEWEDRMAALYGPGIVRVEPRRMSGEEHFAWRLALIAARATDDRDEAYDRLAKLANDAEAMAHRAAEAAHHQRAEDWMMRSELYDHAMAACELLMSPLVHCPRGCGLVAITESGHNGGFAGGTIYWDNLACGHSIVDESDDVAAAR